MSPKNMPQQTKSSFDVLKWLLILLLLLGGFYANYYYASTAWAIRAALGIVLAAILLAIASQTAKGRNAWGFIRGARTELRKVVWPTRQETVQTTMIVAVMVVVTALILWGLDSLFMWLVGLLTGQRG